MNSLIRSSRPFASLVDQFFDDGFFAPSVVRKSADSVAERAFAPAVDLSQDEGEYRIRVDLPGMSREDISLAIDGETLTLSGERSFEASTEGESFNRVERSYGKFSRTFQLPSNADASQVKATFENGVLTVLLAKKDEAKPREISVE